MIFTEVAIPMKRKLLTAFSAFTILVSSVFALTACDFFATTPDGRYPSDVAIADGYMGTQSSWLAGGEGATTPKKQWFEAYEQAVEAGEFEGTFTQFLVAIGDEGTVVANTALASVVRIQARSSLGTGVISSLDKTAGDAYIVTNYHVLYDVTASNHISDILKVYLYGSDREMQAEYVGGVLTKDLAVLKVTNNAALKGENCFARAAVAADSDAVTAGETVYVVGNALGLGLSVTRGVVSVAREEITAKGADSTTVVTLPAIRTDAAVNHGNSGGGLFNANGELVGIVNARLESVNAGTQQEQSVSGVGYALPANFAMAVAENLIDNGGTIALAQLGLGLGVGLSKTTFDEETGRLYTEEAIIVHSTLNEKGAAFLAGIRNGDTLVSATIVHPATEGEEPERERTVALTRFYKLGDLLYNVRKNDTLLVTVSRNGEAKELSVSFSSLTCFTVVE